MVTVGRLAIYYRNKSKTDKFFKTNFALILNTFGLFSRIKVQWPGPAISLFMPYKTRVPVHPRIGDKLSP